MEGNIIKVAVCDDEAIALHSIKKKIEPIINEFAPKYIISFDYYLSGTELLSSLLKYDVYILDVEMPEINGFDVGIELRKRQSTAIIIFLTNKLSDAPAGYRLGAHRYIIKNNVENEITEAFASAIKKIFPPQSVIALESIHGMVYENIMNIIFIEADQKKSNLQLVDHYIWGKKPLKYWMDLLPSEYFVSAHKKHIINLAHLKKVTGNEAHMSNGEVITISRRLLQSVKDAKIEYIKLKARS